MSKENYVEGTFFNRKNVLIRILLENKPKKFFLELNTSHFIGKFTLSI